MYQHIAHKSSNGTPVTFLRLPDGTLAAEAQHIYNIHFGSFRCSTSVFVFYKCYATGLTFPAL